MSLQLHDQTTSADSPAPYRPVAGAMMADYSHSNDAQTVALLAIGWIVAEEGRAERYLSLTGLDAAQLRERLNDGSALGGALDFLLAHEPDLIAFAADNDLTPGDIDAARRALD